MVGYWWGWDLNPGSQAPEFRKNAWQIGNLDPCPSSTRNWHSNMLLNLIVINKMREVD